MKLPGSVLVLMFAAAAMASPDDAHVTDLEAGFYPDPTAFHISTIVGQVEQIRFEDGPAWALTGGGRGHLGLNYRAGRAPRLYIQFVGGHGNADWMDPVLVVTTPDGRLLASNDLIGPHPGIVVQNPASGYYDVGVGVYSRAQEVGGAHVSGTIYVSEVGFVGEGDQDERYIEEGYPPVAIALTSEEQLSYEDDYVVIEPDAGRLAPVLRHLATIVRYYIEREQFDRHFPGGYDGSRWMLEGYSYRTLTWEDGVFPDNLGIRAPAGGFAIREYAVYITSVEQTGR